MICAKLIVLTILTYVTNAELEIVNQWNLLNFDIPFHYPKRDSYQPQRTVFTSVEIGWDRLFLSIPRLYPGLPATIGWIPRNKPGIPGELSPVVQAYPSWDWHTTAAAGTSGQSDNCTGIISVFRVRADRCNRLWILDSGVSDSLVSFSVVCPPKLLIFDLKSDTLVRSVTLPQEVLRPNSLLTNLVLDDQNIGPQALGGYGSCDNMFIYMSDTTNPGIIVYDSAKDTTWRIQHPFMFPDPDWGTYKVAGESFTLMDGIIGLALSPLGVGPRTLYFQPFASDRLFSIPVTTLQRGPNSGDDGDLPVTLVGHKSSQAAGLAFEPRTGALYFCPVSETAVASWVPGSPNHRVVAYNPELLQFPTDIRSADRDNGNIWLVTTRFQKFFRNSVNPREINLRIMRIKESHTVPDTNSIFLLNKKK